MFRRSARWVASNAMFCAAFASLALFAWVTAIVNPIGPGQDFNYHLMSASLAARGWTGDAAVTALYHQVNPSDANTLLYSLLFPFELLLGPVRGFAAGVGLLYFVGYPAACAAALAIFRRPLWGSLLAFPLCWVRTYCYGGFMPFVSAAPWLVLGIALFHRALTDAQDPGALPLSARTRRRRMAAAMAVIAFCFLAHAHVFGWLEVLLATITLWSIGQSVARTAPFSPRGALATAFRTGFRAVLIVLPSLLLLGSWWLRRSYGAHAVAPAAPLPSPDTAREKLDYAYHALVHVRGDAEFSWAAALLVVALACVMLSSRSRQRLPSPEIAFLVTFASCFVLPFSVNDQGFGARQIDLAQWLLPLVVLPRMADLARARQALVVAILAAFAFGREAFLAAHLRAFQSELSGLFEMAKPCPVSDGEMAYVTFGREPADWSSASLHQSHETLAALCHIDTPVYDTRAYPRSLQPLRYKGALPAPVTILTEETHDAAGWYAHPHLWRDFDVVLVRNWNPTEDELREALTLADRVRVSGTWQLWRRK